MDIVITAALRLALCWIPPAAAEDFDCLWIERDALGAGEGNQPGGEVGEILNVGYLGALESGDFQLKLVVAQAPLCVLGFEPVHFRGLGAELGLQQFALALTGICFWLQTASRGI